MKKMKLTWIFVIVSLLVLSSCSNSINQGMDNNMQRGMMHNTGNQGGQLSSIDRSIEGLDRAESSKIVEIGDGETYDLEAKPVAKEINGNLIRMYAYNGQIPAPMIKVRQGGTIYVDFKNNMEFETTIHWHGLRHDYKFDGMPKISQPPVNPGESFLYKLSFPDAGIFWYHPHIREDLGQELGLYGNILVMPSDEQYYNKVDSEVTLFLDDIKLAGSDVYPFDANQATFTFMGRYGNVLLINGEEEYNLDVIQGDVARFYLTDSANVRPFNFMIEGHKLKLIGSDLSNFEKESFVDSIIINPGERYTVEVLFDKEGSFKIQHKTPSKTYNLGTISVMKSDVKTNNEFSKLKENKNVESDIEKYKEYFNAKPDYEFLLTLNQNMMGGMMGGSSAEIEWEDSGHSAMMNEMSDTHNVEWIIKDKATGKENMDINYKVKKGDVKKLRIINDPNSMHPMQHPIHLHGQRFLVLNVDGKQNENLAWKDTVMVPAGKTVDILIDFSNPGEWMLHCHIAEHLEAGMMTMFTVI